MGQSKKVLSWFEIPATDIDRAVQFYQTVLGRRLERRDLDKVKIAILAQGAEISGGAIIQGEGRNPHSGGVLVYFNANVAETLKKVGESGGKIIVPATEVEGDFGIYAVIQDTEGNKVGLHQY